MRYYLDTEFNEDGRTIDLISIALVCEDGREFYAVSKEAELHRVNEWVRVNVLPLLPPPTSPEWMTRAQIRDGILAFLGKDKPTFWAYFADYDWVAFCQLFGRMVDLPRQMPQFCMDLKQLAVMKGNPRLPPQREGNHNALADARWNRDIHHFLDACGQR